MYTRVHLLAYRRSYRSLSNFNVKGMLNAMGPWGCGCGGGVGEPDRVITLGMSPGAIAVTGGDLEGEGEGGDKMILSCDLNHLLSSD